MSNEPDQIRIDQIRDALEVLGLGRDVTDLESVSIEVDRVIVTRRRRSEKGQFPVVPFANMLATVRTEVPLVGEL
jgi:hypothetical protein